LSRIKAEGGTGFAQSLDVTSASDWDALHREILGKWGSLDVLINNAGVAAAGRREDSTIEDWQWLLDIDLMGVVRGCHKFLPMFREQNSGHIVNVASFAGMTQAPELSAYATAKAGVVALSEQLRVDLDGSGVGVSLLCPAFVKTRLLETFRSPDERHRKQADRWMSGSAVKADHVAEMVSKALKKNRFLVLTHAQTRWAWRFRRWFPERYHRIVLGAASRIARKHAT